MSFARAESITFCQSECIFEMYFFYEWLWAQHKVTLSLFSMFLSSFAVAIGE